MILNWHGNFIQRFWDAPWAGNQINGSISVDGDKVPALHFGVILPWNEWESLGKKISESAIHFMIEPKTRFKEGKGEQGTFFIQDPSGNALEFKSFKNDKMVFEN